MLPEGQYVSFLKASLSKDEYLPKIPILNQCLLATLGMLCFILIHPTLELSLDVSVSPGFLPLMVDGASDQFKTILIINAVR